MTEHERKNGIGTAGTSGTALNFNTNSGPACSGHPGTEGTVSPGSAATVPAVPVSGTTTGPEKRKENSVVPLVPPVPVGLAGATVGERLATALGAVFAPASEGFDADKCVAFEERAAIAEYDGGLSREDAETIAAREQGYESTEAFRAACRFSILQTVTRS